MFYFLLLVATLPLMTPQPTPLAMPSKPQVLVKLSTVDPVGWRRTAHGWERWEPTPPSIHDWIHQQIAEESRHRWLAVVESLTLVHPVSIAAGQLAIVCMLAAFAHTQAESSRRARKNTSASTAPRMQPSE